MKSPIAEEIESENQAVLKACSQEKKNGLTTRENVSKAEFLFKYLGQ